MTAAGSAAGPRVRVESPTEQRNDRTTEIDRVGTAELLALINEADAGVPAAVAAAREELARLVVAAGWTGRVVATCTTSCRQVGGRGQSATGFTGTSIAFDPATRGWAILLTNVVHYGRRRPEVFVRRRRFHAVLVGD